MSDKVTSGMAPFLYIGGAIFILFGVWLLKQNMEGKNFDGIEARGTIVSYEMIDGKRVANIEFYTKDSTLVSFKDSDSRLITRQKKELDIIYPDNNPEMAVVYDPYDIWGIPLSIMIVGLFIAMFGLVINLVTRKRKNKKGQELPCP